MNWFLRLGSARAPRTSITRNRDAFGDSGGVPEDQQIDLPRAESSSLSRAASGGLSAATSKDASRASPRNLFEATSAADPGADVPTPSPTARSPVSTHA